MSTFITGRLEARGMTASSADVRGLENFFGSTHRPYGESSTTFSTRPASSYTGSQTKNSHLNHNSYQHYNNGGYDINNNNGNNHKALPYTSRSLSATAARSSSTTTPALLLRYLNPKEMKLDLNDDGPDASTATATGTAHPLPHNGFINSMTTRAYRSAQSAGPARPSTKRQIAVQCGIKTIPFDGRRWKNEKNTSSPSSASGKGHIMFQDPLDGNQSRRGLRGSKVRPGASTPRPASQVRQNKRGSLETPLGYRESSVISTPRHLSISTLQHSQTSLNDPISDDEESQETAGGYGWNASDQAVRLQKHVSSKTSIRAMRRVSEMVHHRLDPMYKINGSKVTLQDRYCVDGMEMQKLQEMTITREELLSDLRKMKFHNGSRSYDNSQMNAQKHRLLQQNISRLQKPGNNSSIFPPTPSTSNFVDTDTVARNPHHHNPYPHKQHNNNNDNNNDDENAAAADEGINNNNDDSNDNNNGGGGGRGRAGGAAFKQLSHHSEEDDIIDIIDDDDGDDDDQFDDERLRGQGNKEGETTQ